MAGLLDGSPLRRGRRVWQAAPVEPRLQGRIEPGSKGTPLVRLLVGLFLRSALLRQVAWRFAPRSRLSRATLLELARRLYGEFNDSGRFPLATVSRDVVGVQASELVGGHGSFEGHAGLQSMVDELREAWGLLRFEPEEVYEAGDRSGVLVLVRARTAGLGSGARTDRVVAHLFTFPRGSITRFEVFWEPGEGVAAARRMTGCATSARRPSS